METYCNTNLYGRLTHTFYLVVTILDFILCKRLNEFIMIILYCIFLKLNFQLLINKIYHFKSPNQD